MRVITLTTDFGLSDSFVGSMKGVILGIAPDVRLVDITHQIPAGNIRAGALALASSCSFFPRGTVHLAVVDPGVGSDRAPIAIEVDGHYFVGPDNGVLSLASARDKGMKVHRLENRRYFRNKVSRTFHGRDLFAPVAAHLVRGVPLARFGPRHASIVAITIPEARRARGGIQGEIIHIDRFGNAQTNIEEAEMGDISTAWQAAVSGRKTPIPFRDHYHAVAEGKPLALINSSGYVELAVNGDNAARKLGLALGQPVTLRKASRG